MRKIYFTLLALLCCVCAQASDYYTYTLVNSSDSTKGFKLALTSDFKTQVNESSGGSFAADDGTTWVTGDPLPAFETVHEGYSITSLRGIFSGYSTMTSLDLSLWDVSSVTDMSYMLQNCSKLTSLDGLEDWDVSSVTNMDHMFYWCCKVTSLEPLAGWDVSNVTNTSGMFYRCHEIASLEPLAGWDVSSVTNMGSMFYWCNDVTTLEPLANWDVSNVTNMSNIFYLFSGVASLEPLAGWDVSSVTNMSGMFYYCSKVTSLEPLAGWDVSSVTNMSGTFYNCSKVTSLEPLAGWDVSNVTDMSSMFNTCSKVTSLEPLAGWDVSSVTNISSMFENCYALTTLEGLEAWDVSNVTTMGATFKYCTGLSSLEALCKWDVSKVKSLYYTFTGCGRLTTLEGLENWDVSSVTNMAYMFRYCTGLSSLEALCKWDVSSVTNMAYMFHNTSRNSVGVYDLSGWDVSSVTTSTDMFGGISANIDTRSAGYAKDLETAAWFMNTNNRGKIMFIEATSTNGLGLGTYSPQTYHNYEITDTCQVRAYTAKMSNGKITLTPTTHVRAGEGVLLRSISGTLDENNIGETASAECLLVPDYKYDFNEDNDLVGVQSDSTLQQKDVIGGVTYYNFVLGRSGDNYRFYKVPAAGTTISAGKAYLHWRETDESGDDSGAKSASAVKVSFADASGDTTSICEIIAMDQTAYDEATSAEIYSITGQKFSSPSRGINIIGGKKVTVK